MIYEARGGLDRLGYSLPVLLGGYRFLMLLAVASDFAARVARLAHPRKKRRQR